MKNSNTKYKSKIIKIPKSVLLLFFFAIVLVFAVSEAEAATYYIDQSHPQANDSNPGTAALPWASLCRATVNGVEVQPGDTVIIKAGTYSDAACDVVPAADSWESALNPYRSGTAANPITFKSEPQYAAILERNKVGDPAFGVNSRSYIVVDGFKITSMIRAQLSDYITFKNNECINGGRLADDVSLNWCIELFNVSFGLVQNNYVHDLVSEGNNGINTAAIMCLACSDSIFEYNDAAAGPFYSVFGQKGGSAVNTNIRSTWRYNIARGGATAFLGKGSTNDAYFSDYNDWHQNIIINSTYAFEFEHNVRYSKVYNNVVYNSNRFLHSWYGNTTNEIYNNISYSASGGRVYHTDTTPFSTLISYSDYNDFYNYGAIFAYQTGGTYASSLAQWQSLTIHDDNSIQSNPLFVNASGGDFHLQLTSPAKDTGIDRQDYDGDGNTTERINMGAYIIGNETIGLLSGQPQPPDITPPSAPTGLIVQ